MKRDREKKNRNRISEWSISQKNGKQTHIGLSRVYSVLCSSVCGEKTNEKASKFIIDKSKLLALKFICF